MVFRQGQERTVRGFGILCLRVKHHCYIQCLLYTFGTNGQHRSTRCNRGLSQEFGLGFFASSLVPSSVAMAKAIGLFGAARFSADTESLGKEVAFTFGAALVALINLTASVITIAVVALPAILPRKN